jgi:hypothetical protein
MANGSGLLLPEITSAEVPATVAEGRSTIVSPVRLLVIAAQR